MYIQSPCIVRTVYSRIFWDIQGYWCIFSRTLRRATKEEGEVSHTLFENQKKCRDFWKKGSDCAHLWVKFSIQNVVLRVSRRFQNVSLQWFFLWCFWRNLYESALVLQTSPPSSPPCPEKFLVPQLRSGIILLAKCFF